MLTNAKLQVTAAISMLIVSIVLGLFLAVASWDIKEMVLSANVRSNAFEDMFQKEIHVVHVLGNDPERKY